ncbi:type II toxin-antitoxin system RelE/ParE family toxin, partial [Xanthomonas oryzae]|uniref:type II toxin-antitoxin system RelE/ParE family toxin n=1 Tax=Xanthomonas oryzae TaxID=347 RepID=UPI000960C31E
MLRRDWTVPAATQLAHAQDHYHALNPTAAAAMARQVLEATRTLGCLLFTSDASDEKDSGGLW